MIRIAAHSEVYEVKYVPSSRAEHVAEDRGPCFVAPHAGYPSANPAQRFVLLQICSFFETVDELPEEYPSHVGRLRLDGFPSVLVFIQLGEVKGMAK
jgi:hypothetical protein